MTDRVNVVAGFIVGMTLWQDASRRLQALRSWPLWWWLRTGIPGI